MLAERTVFNRAFRVTPLWLWGLQRVSGVLLGPLVAIHMLVPQMGKHAGLNAVLLVLVLVHGYGGVRRVATMRPKNALYTACALAWCVAVALFGLLVVAADIPG